MVSRIPNRLGLVWKQPMGNVVIADRPTTTLEEGPQKLQKLVEEGKGEKMIV